MTRRTSRRAGVAATVAGLAAIALPAGPAHAAGEAPQARQAACPAPGTWPAGVVAVDCETELLNGITILEDAGPITVDVAIGWDADTEDSVTIGSGVTGHGGCDWASQSFASRPSGFGNEVIGAMTFALVPNCSGSITAQIQSFDSTLSSFPSFPFRITVLPVNDAPTLSIGSDLIVTSDGSQSVVGFASATPGPADEAGQTVTYEVVAGPGLAFSLPPFIDAGGDLHYAIAPGATGTATVTVTAVDDGGTDNGGVDRSAPMSFTITRPAGQLVAPGPTPTPGPTDPDAGGTPTTPPTPTGPGAARTPQAPSRTGAQAVPTTGTLPRTGTATTGLTAFGGGLLLLGAALIAGSRRSTSAAVRAPRPRP